MTRLIGVLGVLGVLLLSSPAVALLVVFDPGPGSHLLDGYTQGGITLHGHWNATGQDARNAPFMNSYPQSHALSYGAGTFDFQAITLGGLPWEGFAAVTGDGLLTLRFEDAHGGVIATRVLYLPRDTSWQTLAEPIAGVHAIVFPALGGPQPSGGWKDGFFPRLDSLRFEPNAPMPPVAPTAEPGTLLLLGSAVAAGGLAFFRRRPAAASGR